MNKKSRENNPILAVDWEKIFAQREKLFGVKMTSEQKENWANNYTSAEAKKALELRRDLKRIYDQSQISPRLTQQLECELNSNLLANIKKELPKYGEHYSLEKPTQRIDAGYYGDWGGEWEPNF